MDETKEPQEQPTNGQHSEPALLSANQILEAEDMRTVDVPCPEWEGTVRVRGLTGAERDSYEEGLTKETSKGTLRLRLANARAKLVVLAAVGPDGRPMFTEDHIQQLGRKSAKALDRVYDAAATLSGISDKDLKELVEDFDSAQSELDTSA